MVMGAMMAVLNTQVKIATNLPHMLEVLSETPS
jgi:hypothetical protein